MADGFGLGPWGGVGLGGGGAGDTTPPIVVYTYDPPPVQTDAPVTVTVTDNLDLLDLFLVLISFPSVGISEVVWDGTGQGPRYTGAGNALEVVGTTGRRLTFLRSGGWPAALMTITTRGWDSDGNMGVGVLTLATLQGLPAPALGGGAGESGLPARVFKVDPLTGDMVREGGRFVRIGGIESIAQDIDTAVKLIAGENFLDLDEGIPYFEDESDPAKTAILVKNPNLQAVREVFRGAVAARPGVRSVRQLDLQRVADRSFALTLACDTDLGELGPVVVSLEV